MEGYSIAQTRTHCLEQIVLSCHFLGEKASSEEHGCQNPTAEQAITRLIGA